MPEHTIAENLTRLTTARTDIADAIVAKGGTVTAGDGFEEFPADIATIPTGSQSVARSDVNFFDYDGTVVYSYTASEFATLTAMPSNPSHAGLTAQGWNWSLADAKAYVAKYGKLNIGQMYKTSDGALRLYIRLEEGRLSPVLGLCPNGTLTVDWGDGSATETMTGSSTSTLVYLGHTYAAAGDYVISVTPSAGSKIGFGQRDNSSTILCKSQNDSANDRRVYLNAIYKVELPDSITSIGGSAFHSCYSLTSVTIPDSVTSIGGSAFAYCYALASVTVPNSVTSIGGSALNGGSNLSIITIPDSVTSIGSSTFAYGYNLTSVIIPDSVTSIGNNAFYSCYSLTSATIPDSVASIGSNAFNSCYGLGSIKFASTTPPEVSNSNAWTGIPTDCIIYVTDGYLEDYEDATNFPDPDVYQYVEY